MQANANNDHGAAADDEGVWAFLAPWWRVLRAHRLSLPVERAPGSLCPAFSGLRIVAPTANFQRLRDALELVFVLSIVDRKAFKRLALAHCEQLVEVVDAANATFPTSDHNVVPRHVEISFVEPVSRRSLVGTPSLLLPLMEAICMTSVASEDRDPSFREALRQLLQIISDDVAMADVYGRLSIHFSIDIEGVDTFRALLDTAATLQRRLGSGQCGEAVSLFRLSRISLATRHFPSIILTAQTLTPDFSWVSDDAFSKFLASSPWRGQVSKQCLALQYSSGVPNLRVACHDNLRPQVPPRFIVWLVHAIFSNSAHSIHNVVLDSFAINDESLDALRRHIAAALPVERLEELRIDNVNKVDDPLEIYRFFRFQTHNVRSLAICSLDGRRNTVSRARILREFLHLVGEPLEELVLSGGIEDRLLLDTMWASCPQLRTLKLCNRAMPGSRDLINSYESEKCSVSKLEVLRPGGSSSTEFVALLSALQDPTLRISQVIKELSLSLGPRQFEVQPSLGSILLDVEKLIERLVQTNVTLTFLQLKLPRSLFTRLKPLFLALDNAWLAGIRIPVPLRAKVAFISVVNETLIVPGEPLPAIAFLDEAMVANILTLAGNPVRRRLVLTSF